MFPVLGEKLVPGLGALTGNPLVKLLDRIPLEDSDPGRENESLQSGRSRSSRTSRRGSVVHAGQAARQSAVDVAVRGLLPKKTHILQESSKNSWHLDHPAEQCMQALGYTCSAARKQNAIVPIGLGAVLTAATAENAAASYDDTVDTSAVAAADAAWGAVEPTAVDDADVREAVKLNAANDADNDDGLCCRAWRNPLGPRCHFAGRCVAA